MASRTRCWQDGICIAKNAVGDEARSFGGVDVAHFPTRFRRDISRFINSHPIASNADTSKTVNEIVRRASCDRLCSAINRSASSLT